MARFSRNFRFFEVQQHNTIQNSVMPTQATMKSVANEKVKVKKLSMTTTIKI